MEDLSGLDHRMFAQHPGGYLCRCGQAHNGKPQHCTCMTDFPEATLSDLSERIRELESGIEAHREAVQFYKRIIWDGDDGVTALPHDLALWSLLDEDA